MANLILPSGDTFLSGNETSPQLPEHLEHQVAVDNHGHDFALAAPDANEGIRHGHPSAVITVVRDPNHKLGKRFALDSDGIVSKKSAVHLSFGIAVQHDVPTPESFVELLNKVGADPNAAIINASFDGIPVGEEFAILSEREFEKRLSIPCSDREKQKGVHTIEHDGKNIKVVGRFKENIRPSSWQLLDRDVDAQTPAEFATLSDVEWLSALAKILPGIDQVTTVSTRSTSSRVMRDGEAVGGGNGHVWIKLDNPDDAERVRAAIIFRAAQSGLTWLKARFSRTEPGKVVGQSLTTIIDPSVWTPGRLVFIGKPVVGDGLTVAPLTPVIHQREHDSLDTAAVVLPDAGKVREITRKAGGEMSVSTGHSGLRISANDLTLDTELETENDGVLTVRQLVERGNTGKIRCQTPFRASESWAAFFNTNADGIPFVHDVGTSTTHWLNAFEAEEVRIIPAQADVKQLMPKVKEDAAAVLEDDAVKELATSKQSKPVDQVIAQLATLSRIDYDHARKDAAQRLGIQLKTLDDMVQEARNQATPAAAPPFPTVEPWPEPIDPALLLNEISSTVRRFIVLEPAQADAIALWVAHTYLIAILEISPILIVDAPERACAKTLLQTLLARLTYRSLPASNASLSALFRSVELWRPTIFIDEADTFFGENRELHGLVNAGYAKSGFILRSEAVGDSFEPRMFSVYCAKSIAGINLARHLPDATMSRGIVINLRRKLAHESVERLRHADNEIFEQLASKLARFALDYSARIRESRPALPDALSDRAQDNWDALFAIAECAGPTWVEFATSAALKLSNESEASASRGNELLADIKAAFERKKVTKISTADLLEALVSDDTEAPWGTYNRGKPLSPRQLGRLLDPYGIHSKTVRMGPFDTPKGFDIAQFEDAFSRYLTPLPRCEGDLDAFPTMAEIVVDVPPMTADSLPDVGF